MIHKTSNKGKYWYQRGRDGFSVGPAIHHYRCIQETYGKTKALIIMDNSEYLHRYLPQPYITAEDRMTHTIQFLTAVLKDVPESICNSQLAAIDTVREIFTNGKINPSRIKKQDNPSSKDKQRQKDTGYPLTRVTKKTNWPQLPRVH